jgi:hypothetical protein
MDTKLFDVHFDVGQEGSQYYTRNVIGNNGLEFKHLHSNCEDSIILVISDMNTNGVLNSLVRDPSASDFPIPPPVQRSATSGTVGHPLYNMGPSQMFELHAECGKSNGRFYAYTVLNMHGNQTKSFRSPGNFLDDALCDLVVNMSKAGMFVDMAKYPTMSLYPFPSASASPSSSSVSSPPKKKQEIKRVLPSECIGFDHPACRDHCTSWDFFGEVKCRNMCEWRKL